ncbi:glucuronate isomerase, partial [Luteococcus sp.]|uniref:glucuronate isomerase n=1 Tax=Luteococcus sp. TaxID=1969402 RepID=UPI00373591E2
MAPAMTLHPDRLLPADPTTRAIARRLYDEVKDLPIISPHGHVPPAWIADDLPFGNPTELLITPDHYVNRLMHANGVELSTLGVPVGTEMSQEQSREAWRTFCSHWSDYNGTAMRYWMQDQLVGIFGIDQRPSAETADAIYDTIDAKLATPEMRPRALMDSFDISFIATTDDPCDDLHHHEKIA